MVCFEHGKKAETYFKVLGNKSDNTRIEFYPKTGRTHQLRVHAAHQLGLNCPILGDELYGIHGARLHLHAKYLAFYHPQLKQPFHLHSKVPF
jgi:tRNA pseudouridine32 synthase/23S rRNA pseudouridine746 synthase